ncbi:YceI family protein [Luteitalea sp.]|jgi:polyisoprenoid-binding protein YceI|uniref:YceI family protein n=1 Tax=Luteitalea sp. TaxID=2004800 RepID=UPI0037C7037E
MTTATAPALATYAVDPAHSEATFTVRHLITKVRGRFAEFEGTIGFDAEDPTRSTVAFTIKAASIDTNQKDRDAHLRSADFFEVEKYPTITFTSTGITASGDGAYAVTGHFTIRDVTQAITLPVTYLGTAKDPWGNQRIAFEAETTINRKEYGLMWNAALETGGFLVGDEVKIALSIQAVPAQS